MTVENIITGCRNNDRQAWEHFHRRYHRLLMRVCLHQTKDFHMAQDAYQEGLVRIWQGMHSVDDYDSFVGWITVVMRNTAYSFMRKKYVRWCFHEAVNIDPVNETKVGGITEQDSDLLHEAIHNSVEALPRGMKQIFEMYALNGFKHKEIANILGIDENTSKSQFCRAKSKLRDELRPFYRNPDLLQVAS